MFDFLRSMLGTCGSKIQVGSGTRITRQSAKGAYEDFVGTFEIDRDSESTPITPKIGRIVWCHSSSVQHIGIYVGSKAKTHILNWIRTDEQETQKEQK